MFGMVKVIMNFEVEDWDRWHAAFLANSKMREENHIKEKYNIKTYTLDNENHVKFTPKNGKVKRNVFLLVIIDGKISRISFRNF